MKEITYTQKNICNVTTFIVSFARINKYSHMHKYRIFKSPVRYLLCKSTRKHSTGEEYCDLILSRVRLHCLKWVDMVNKLLLSIFFRDG